MTKGRVFIGDCRAAGYCLKGVRRRCGELGLDFRRLVKEGIPFGELDGVDDLAVTRSREAAIKRMEAEHGRR